MLRHTGTNRTPLHNLRLASLFSFVAGIVNVTGLLSLQRLTTNVTGHFAYAAEGVIHHNFQEVIQYLAYILFFLLGAFVSNLCTEGTARRNAKYVYLLPVSIELVILLVIALLDQSVITRYGHWLAEPLLFAMGLQNALVTGVSHSVVRTTHLTGLFTDLGIELSQLFFYRTSEQRTKLHTSIRLRLTIITCFFGGCIVGGFGYFHLGIRILLLAVACLAYGLIYDTLRYGVMTLKRRYLR